MITLSKSEDIGLFGRIVDNPPRIELSPTGRAFEAALSEWLKLYPNIAVPVYQVMPDHIHLCVDVQAYLKRGLSTAIARLMGRTTRVLDCGASAASTKAFAKGFNDRIAYTPDQWQRQQNYIADNPRRYIIKKLHPDLFYKTWIIDIAGESYMAKGNILLLKNPDIQVVRFSRRYSKEEFEAKKMQWAECARTGGVLVSPFIHPEEKAARQAALEFGASVIRVCENGFGERFSPQGEEFEYNGGSQLLLIAPTEHNTQREAMTYAKAQTLNRLAEKIAATDWNAQPARIRPHQ